MVKDIKYVIKRILIGVGIALILSFFRYGFILNTHAKEISSVWAPFSSTNTFGLNNMTEQVSVGLNTGNWANWGFGKLRFNFTLIKVSGSATAPLVVPQNVVVNNILCDISSTSTSNSTFTGQSYTATCSMNMGSNGLNSLVFFFTPNQQNEQSGYRLTVGNMFTFETDQNLNFDTSGTTNAINNQITNDNTNTQNIINNQNSNKQDVINNQNQNTQNIINNQNSNTDKEIESQKACNFIDKNEIVIDNKYLNSSGEEINIGTFGITDYIPISSSTIENLELYEQNWQIYSCFYNANKEKISCFLNQRMTTTIPNNASYIRLSISKELNKPQFKLCTNGNQAIVNSQENINNTLNDDTGGEVSSSFFDDFNVDSNSPVSDLLTMPITLLQAYIDGFSGTCRDINLGRLYGHNLIMPCINPGSYLGTELWSLIDSLFTIFMIYNIAMLCITIYEGITSLHDDFSWLYGVEARHAGVPTRVERNSDLY